MATKPGAGGKGTTPTSKAGAGGKVPAGGGGANPNQMSGAPTKGTPPASRPPKR